MKQFHLVPGSEDNPDICLTFGLECKFGSRCVQSDDGNGDDVACSCDAVCDTDDDVTTVNDEASPVCGSDHVTYKNACSLKEASCKKQQNITLIAKVECGKYFTLCASDLNSVPEPQPCSSAGRASFKRSQSDATLLTDVD